MRSGILNRGAMESDCCAIVGPIGCNRTAQSRQWAERNDEVNGAALQTAFRRVEYRKVTGAGQAHPYNTEKRT